ncbi:MAG: hypothetical protein RIQ60_982 [Pseudomonadota bacterium]|jgi:hypothetical protein
MKRKLIVTLVASALELYAASSLAQTAGCLAPNASNTLSNGATAVATGPLNPINGFPEYVTDSTGLSVQRCLDVNFCFFDPPVASDPFSLQIGSGVEAFYWGANNTVFDAAGTRVLAYTAAAESAFLQVGPNGEPINGAQFPFLRLRFTMGVPVDGIYTVVHPYGIDTFDVTGATGARDVFFTLDKGLTASATVRGAVGPFMKADPRQSIVPAGFLGDGGPAAAPVPAIGSPCGWDFVQVTGIDRAGNAVDFGGGGDTLLFSDLWGIQGQIYDGKVQTPVNPTRLTYSRTVAGGGQIDAFGVSTATATMTVQDGPTIATGTGRIASPVTLNRSVYANALTTGLDAASVAVADGSAMPAIVSLTTSDLTALPATDATVLNLHLVDYVDIMQADYDPATHVLAVTAKSGDERVNPALTLREYGTTFAAGNPVLLTTTIAPPAVVHVDSAAGGSATAQVRVISAAPPAAPTGLVAAGPTSHTVTLRWADNANNESGFKVYTLDAAGTRSLVATLGANVTSTTVSGLTEATTYTFQVDAFNGVGAAASNTATATTLALPLAPSLVSQAIAGSPNSRQVIVSFNDNSADETGFDIYRSDNGAAFTKLTTVAPAHAGTGATTFTDVGPLNPSTTYSYQVVAVRGPDASAAVAAAVALTTPAAPAQVSTPSVTAGTSIAVTWTPRNPSSATGHIVYRAPVVGGVVGTFAPISTVQPATPTAPATTLSYTDSTVTLGSSYQYRINAVGWTSYTVGTSGLASATVTAQAQINIVAPTALTASTARRPVIGWTDQSTGETNYRVSRTPMTVSATTGAVTAGATTIVSSTIAPLATPATGGAMSFNESTQQSTDVLIRYDVQALNGATPGAAAQVYAITAALPNLAAAPSTGNVVGGGIRLNWTALTTATIGGYEIQRCTGVGCTNFTTLTTVNGRNSTTFTDPTATTAGTTYRYQMRAVGGVGTNVTPGAFSGTATRVR